jgi:hypothetical protein
MLLVLSGCHKRDSGSSGGYWYIYQAYNPVGYTTRSDTAGVLILTASGTPIPPNDTVNEIRIWLGSLPATSANFAIHPLSYYGTPAGLPGPNQLSVSGVQADSAVQSCSGWGVFAASGFSSINPWPGNPADSATVTVTNGKIKVVIPQMMADYVDRCGNDSPYIRAVIQEQ